MYNSLLLNIIKFFLAFTVLVSHMHIFAKSQEYFSVCVDAFMIISGFTLTTGYKNDADFNYTKYFYRRLLRIYPMFFLYIIFIMLTSDIFAYRALYFFDNTRDFYGTSMWSLHQEIKLYLIFPLLLYLIKKYSNRYNFIFATLIIYYIAISIIALYGHDVKKFYGHNLWAFTMCWNKLNGVFFGIAFERCLIGFALGILIAIHGKIIKLSDYWFLAIIIVCIAFVKFNFISCFLVIFSFAHLMPKIISSNLIMSTKATNFWTKMGYLSYPIYLFQDRTIMRFMKFANKYFALDTNLYIFIMFSCIAIYIIAIYIICETYEKWIINKIKNLKFAKQIQTYSGI